MSSSWTGSGDSQFNGTASYATQALSASYALTASYETYIDISSSWASQSLSASWAPGPDLSAYLSASWSGSSGSQFGGTSSYADYTATASYVSQSIIFPTAVDYTFPYFSGSTITTSSGLYQINDTISASIPIVGTLLGTASFALNAGGTSISTGSTYPITASWSVYTDTASYVSQSIIFPTAVDNTFPYFSGSTITTSSGLYQINDTISASIPIVGSLTGTASYALTASFASNVIQPNLSAYLSSSWTGSTTSVFSGTASYANNALSASWSPSNAIVSASWASQSISSSYALNAATASYPGFAVNQSGSINFAGIAVVVEDYTGSRRAAWYDYYVSSASNQRMGTVMATWNNSTVEYTEVATLDIGSTTDCVLEPTLNGSSIRLLSSASIYNWSVKAIARYL